MVCKVDRRGFGVGVGVRRAKTPAGVRGRRGSPIQNPGRGPGLSGFGSSRTPTPAGSGISPVLNFFLNFFSSRARALSTVLSTSSSRPPACAGYSRSFNEHQSSPHPRLRRRRPLRAQRAAAAAEEEEEEGEEARWRRLSPPWLSCA